MLLAMVVEMHKRQRQAEKSEAVYTGAGAIFVERYSAYSDTTLPF